MLELVLISKKSLPIYFKSKKTKETDGIETAAFLNAINYFVQSNLKSSLRLLRLGNLNLWLREDGDLLFVFGIDADAKFNPTAEDLDKLVIDFRKVWQAEKTSSSNLINVDLLTTTKFDECFAKHNVKKFYLTDENLGEV